MQAAAVLAVAMLAAAVLAAAMLAAAVLAAAAHGQPGQWPARAGAMARRLAR